MTTHATDWKITRREKVDDDLTLCLIECEATGFVVAENVDGDFADLITAAPDLLENCAALILLIKMMAKTIRLPDAEFEEVVAPARAAIAKAKAR